MRQAGRVTELHAEPLEALRARTSEKWRSYPADVLPLFVAEMDYPLAPPVAAAIIDRVNASDTGYAGSPGGLPDAFAGFAARSWGWSVDPARVRTTTDVSVTIVESLRQSISPGDGVVINPPVYHPFFELIPEAGGRVIDVPLVDGGTGWALDLDGLERAFAAGARAFLLCNPHNPLGLVHSRHSLEAVAELAARYDVVVISDEIHGPLTREGVDFTPFLSVSEAARSVGIAVTSASKAWNLAGVKCAIMIAASDETTAILDRMPSEVGFRTSLLGLHASIAAFTEGEPWLADALAAVARSHELLRALLAERLPLVEFQPPEASYLAWLDFRALGWGDDPAARILSDAKVALNSGLSYGQQGAGFARLNVACSPEVMTDAVERISRLLN
jgi:cystathionine beta-lyase